MTEPDHIEGTEFGPYTLIRRIGEGAMGEVLLATDNEAKRQVALKRPWARLEADRSAIRRFEREAAAIAVVNHPGICRMYDFGRVDGRNYIAMELIEGENLGTWVQKQPELEAPRALRIIQKTALALSAMHDAGVIHRDLKPANIMIRSDESPVITDFGMASLIQNAFEGSRITPIGAVVGTPAYMSPEQILCEEDRYCPASDLYSLGVILYELLSGWPPFSGSLATMLGAIVAEPPADLQIHVQSLDAGLNTICQKALEKETEDRFQSGQEFAQAIETYLSEQPESATSAPATDPKEPENPPETPPPKQETRLIRVLKSVFG